MKYIKGIEKGKDTEELMEFWVKAAGMGAVNNQRTKNKFNLSNFCWLRAKNKPMIKNNKLGYKITPM